MSLNLINDVMVEGQFKDKDEFERSGVIRDDVFAIRNSQSPTKQIQFDASGLADNEQALVLALSGGSLYFSAAYIPNQPTDWSPAPATVAEALDQLAARLAAIE